LSKMLPTPNLSVDLGIGGGDEGWGKTKQVRDGGLRNCRRLAEVSDTAKQTRIDRKLLQRTDQIEERGMTCLRNGGSKQKRRGREKMRCPRGNIK